MAQTTPLRVGLAGVGTVGAALVELLRERPELANGRSIEVTAVSARSKGKARGVDLAGVSWLDDPVQLAARPDVDVVVELMGGADGAARDTVLVALNAGKPVVTGNKALIATHGLELARLAEAKGIPLLYEAAVRGGAPAVKLVREALAGDRIERLFGILNGTCNFILTEMERSGRSFPEVLAEAQARGFAEADPTTDVGGFDAAHKLVILAAIAFDAAPNLEGAEISGIGSIELIDIRLAHTLGYRIKLLASAERDGAGARVAVEPMLVPLGSPLAETGGALNALYVQPKRVGPIFLQGAGAGGPATAAAVAADLADLAAGARRPVFSRPAADLAPLAAGDPLARSGSAYVRLTVRDRPGVIAAVSEALAEAQVSIDSFLQRPVEDSGHVPIVLTTQAASQAALYYAVRHIAGIEALVEPPRVLRIARI
ncbi:homoserine dehydrogenase [soil metagenome]